MEMTSSSEQMIKYTYNAHEHTKINKEQFRISKTKIGDVKGLSDESGRSKAGKFDVLSEN